MFYSCIEEEYPQHQQFIDFRQNSTHCISTTCPLPPGSVQTQWFRNGRRMDNSTLRNLTRCASDPYQLYGVYQCTAKLGAGRAHQLVEKVILASRVLPYGKQLARIFPQIPLVWVYLLPCAPILSHITTHNNIFCFVVSIFS